MTIQEILESTGIPCAYFHFKTKQEPPFIVYYGDGQYNFNADDTFYYSYNEYRIEYYYTLKNERNEAAIETALLSAGYQYEKSEDVYIQSQNVFVIYYYI